MTVIISEIDSSFARHNGSRSAGDHNVDLEAVTNKIPLSASTSSEEYVNAMSSAVTGVNVITTDGRAGRFGITVSAMSSVSADPPMVLVCVNRRSPACNAVRLNETFCVNVLSTRQHHFADIFAGRSNHGKPYQFNRAAWTLSNTSVPRLIDATSTFDCKVKHAFDAGSHSIFIGLVIGVTKGGEKPLLYTNRSYGHPCRWT